MATWATTLCLVVALVAVVQANVQLSDEDNINKPLKKVTTKVKRPKNVVEAHEGETYKLINDNDVLVMFVTQKYECDTCASVGNDFYTVAGQFRGYGTVTFAQLDAEEEADEYHQLMNDHPDFHWFVPMIMVFKQSYIREHKRPPIGFLLNEHVARDLPLFVHRMIGAAVLTVNNKDQLLARATSPNTESVSVVRWFEAEEGNDVKTMSGWFRKLFDNIADLERMNIHFSTVSDSARAALLPELNPTGAHVVGYVVNATSSDPHGIDMHPFVFETEGMKSAQEAIDAGGLALRKWVTDLKKRRPGHAYDGLTTYHAEDLYVPEVCGRRTKTGDAVVFTFNATMLDVDKVYAADKKKEMNVGTHRGSKDKALPKMVVTRGLVGLCVGMRRRVVLPPTLAFDSDEDRPDTVTDDTPIQVDIELLTIHDFKVELDSGEL